MKIKLKLSDGQNILKSTEVSFLLEGVDKPLTRHELVEKIILTGYSTTFTDADVLRDRKLHEVRNTQHNKIAKKSLFILLPHFLRR